MKKLRKEISDFYKKIFSNSVFKDKIKEKAKKIITEKDLRNLIREEILPLMKKENLNCSEEDLLKYEEKTLKNLPKDALADVSGGVSIKSALWAGGILSMALFGSINANAMDVDPFASNPQPTRGSSQQPNNSNNNNNNANQLEDNGDGNHAANNNDRNPAWRSTLYDDLFKKLPQSVQKWASPLIEKGRIVSDGNYLFFFNNKTGSVSPLLPSDVTILIIPPMVWDVNENVHHVNRVSRFAGIGSSELAKITEFVADPRVTELTIASQCFAYNKNLNNVDLQSVKNLKIEEGAFDGCESLSKFITYPKLKSLTIPRRCFANNKTLKSIDFRSVENLIIEEGAFDGCENLVEFILPENPTNVSIAQNAFTGCSALDKTLLVEKYGYVEPPVNNNDNINEPDGDGDNNHNVVNDVSQHQDSNVSISNKNINNFSSIDKNAYSENAIFRKFEGRLSDDVKNSEKFRNAMETGLLLESGECLLSFDPDPISDFSCIYLYVPDDVSEITINAKARNIIFGNKHIFSNYRLDGIYGGKNLKKIKLGLDIENFKFITYSYEERGALEEFDASGARNVIICAQAFWKCKNLKKFTGGSENTEISSKAFLDCTSLCDVILPTGADVSTDAFEGCTSFKGILHLEKNSNNVHTANINNDNGTTNNPAPQNRNVNNFSPIDKNAYSKNATFCKFESRLSDDVKNSEKFRTSME